MADHKKYSLAYLKFLNLIQAIKEMPAFGSIDPVEERLLNMLAGVWHAGKKITVLEAMNLSPDISTTTAHRRLKTLRSKGLIALNTDDIDNRVKYVVGTALSEKYFASLGQAMARAQQVRK